MKYSIKITLIFFIVGLSLSLVYFISYLDIDFEQGEKEPIGIIMNAWPGYSHPLLALEKKYFRKEGVYVNINLVQDYLSMINGFETGDYDGFFGVYSDAILFSAKGIPVKVVYVSDFSEGGDVIISNPEIKRIEDLKGKTISVVELNSFSHLFVLRLLEKYGLEESDVNIVEFSDSEVLRLLEEGKIDAGHTWEPTQSEALARGYNLLATSKEIPGAITDVFVLREEIIKERPKDVQKIVDGLFKAIEFMNKNPEDTYLVISRKTGVGPKEISEGIKGINLLDKEENINVFTKSNMNSLYKNGEFISDFFVERNITDSPVNIDELLVPDFVMKKDNFSKRIIISVIIIFIFTLIGFFVERYFGKGRKK